MQAPGVSVAADPDSRLPYRKPVLHVYGAVKNMTAGLAGSGTDAQGMFMAMTMSDLNTKQNIVRIGTHPLGFGLYLFDYKPEHRKHQHRGQGRRGSRFRHFGVMAQEVLRSTPEAVTMSSAGYLQVAYSRLGITTCSASAHQ